MLGFPLVVQVQCQRQVRYKQVEFGLNLGHVLEGLASHLNSSEHFIFNWFPHTSNCLIQNASKTCLELQRAPRRCAWLRRALVEVSMWLVGSMAKFLAPALNRIVSSLSWNRVVRVEESLRLRDCYEDVDRVWHEYAIPRHEAVYCLLRLKAEIEKLTCVGLSFGLEVNFVRESAVWLSPTYRQDSCVIRVACLKPFGRECGQGDWLEVIDRLVGECGGRPNLFAGRRIVVAAAELAYPRLEEFRQLRRLWDPTNTFLTGRINSSIFQ